MRPPNKLTGRVLLVVLALTGCYVLGAAVPPNDEAQTENVYTANWAFDHYYGYPGTGQAETWCVRDFTGASFQGGQVNRTAAENLLDYWVENAQGWEGAMPGDIEFNRVYCDTTPPNTTALPAFRQGPATASRRASPGGRFSRRRPAVRRRSSSTSSRGLCRVAAQPMWTCVHPARGRRTPRTIRPGTPTSLEATFA